MPLDIGRAVTESFDWLKPKNRREALKLGVLIWLLLVILQAIFTGLAFSGAMHLTAMSSGLAQFAGPLTLLISVFLVAAIAFALFLLAYTLVYFLLLSDAMKYRGFSVKKFSFFNFLGLIASMAAVYVYSLFYSPSRKLRYILHACLILTAVFLGLLTVTGNSALFGLAILLLFVYFIIYYYNTLRLMLVLPGYLEKNQTVMGALEHSLKLTEGNAFSIFVSYIVLAVIIVVIQLIVTWLFLFLSPDSAINPLSPYNILTNLFTAILALSVAYFLSGIYSQLSGRKGKQK